MDSVAVTDSFSVFWNKEAQMGVPAIVQKSTLSPAFKGFDMNAQSEGSDKILEGKQAVVRQFRDCFSSHLSCSQPLLLPSPS